MNIDEYFKASELTVMREPYAEAAARVLLESEPFQRQSLDRRLIKTYWVIEVKTIDGKMGQMCFVLTTAHNADRKAYRTTGYNALRKAIDGTIGWSSELSSPLSASIRFNSSPTPRYSQKVLLEKHQAAVNWLREPSSGASVLPFFRTDGDVVRELWRTEGFES